MRTLNIEQRTSNIDMEESAFFFLRRSMLDFQCSMFVFLRRLTTSRYIAPMRVYEQSRHFAAGRP